MEEKAQNIYFNKIIMHSFNVEYWYRFNGDDMDFRVIQVEAEDETTAIKVAKIRAERGAKNFKVL